MNGCVKLGGSSHLVSRWKTPGDFTGLSRGKVHWKNWGYNPLTNWDEPPRRDDVHFHFPSVPKCSADVPKAQKKQAPCRSLPIYVEDPGFLMGETSPKYHQASPTQASWARARPPRVPGAQGCVRARPGMRNPGGLQPADFPIYGWMDRWMDG